jgi:hypothetical protein
MIPDLGDTADQLLIAAAADVRTTDRQPIRLPQRFNGERLFDSLVWVARQA